MLLETLESYESYAIVEQNGSVRRIHVFKYKGSWRYGVELSAKGGFGWITFYLWTSMQIIK